MHDAKELTENLVAGATGNPDARFMPPMVKPGDLIDKPGFMLSDYGFDEGKRSDAVAREMLRVNDPDYRAARAAINRQLHEDAEAERREQEKADFKTAVERELLTDAEVAKIKSDSEQLAAHELKTGKIQPGALQDRITDLETAAAAKLRRTKVSNRRMDGLLRGMAKR